MSFAVGNATDTERKDFLSELEVMKKLKPHPHVIRLLGCVTESGAEDNIFETAWSIYAFITATTKVIIVHSID